MQLTYSLLYIFSNPIELHLNTLFRYEQKQKVRFGKFFYILIIVHWKNFVDLTQNLYHQVPYFNNNNNNNNSVIRAILFLPFTS